MKLVLHGLYSLVIYLLRIATQASEKSHLEVERKFRISAQDAMSLPARLPTKGFLPAGTVDMTDTFLPAKNEGDMIRIRRESEGSRRQILLTLKKWVVTSDGGKEREETEGSISGVVAVILMWLGRSLRGSSLLSFSKRRQLFAGTLAGRQAVISVDTVSGLGSYSGTYLEIEVLVPVGEDVNGARESIYATAAQLLPDAEQVKQSYMDMLKLATVA